MKHFNYFLLAFLITVTACTYDAGERDHTKYFEGKIIYQISYEGAPADMQSSEKMMGKLSEYYFRQGDFYQDYNGETLEYNLYLKDTNFYYTKHRNENEIMALDCDKEIKHAHPISSIRNSKTHEVILGYDCKMVIVDYDQKISFLKRADFYYDHRLAIDSVWEAHNPVMNASEVFSRIKSIPLKIVLDYGELRVTMTAVKVQDMPLADFFKNKKDSLAVLKVKMMN